LTVVDGSGRQVVANSQVDIVFDSLSEFDNSYGWTLIAELNTFDGNQDSGPVRSDIACGALSVSASQGFDGLCQSAEAAFKDIESRYLTGCYSSLAVEIKVQHALGNRSSDLTWAIGHGGLMARGFFPDGAGYLLRVERDAQRRVRVLVDGSEISPWSVPGPFSCHAGVSVFSSACSPDLGASDVVIDSVQFGTAHRAPGSPGWAEALLRASSAGLHHR
jgi:hypothetical protein